MDVTIAPGAVSLTHRLLTDAEARRLHAELKTTANILGYTVAELRRFSDVFVAEATGRESSLAGVCLSKDLLFGWTEIAVLYVLPEFRGQGMGTALFAAAFDRGRRRERHLYALSRSPETIHLMERLGMETTRAVWRAPLAVHLHQHGHLSSLYRLREAVRKAKMRRGDGAFFVAGQRRFEPSAEPP